jgi:hypothetical protein
MLNIKCRMLGLRKHPVTSTMYGIQCTEPGNLGP